MSKNKFQRFLFHLIATCAVLVTGNAFAEVEPLDSFIPALMRKRSVAGLQICYTRGSGMGPGIDCKSYGVRDPLDKPVENDTLFLAPGLSEPPAALMMLEMLGQKKEIEVPGIDPVSALDLLSNTSGFMPGKHLTPQRTRPKTLGDLYPPIRFADAGKAYLSSAHNYAMVQNYLESNSRDRTPGFAFADWLTKQGFQSSVVAELNGSTFIQMGPGLVRADGLAFYGRKAVLQALPESAIYTYDGLLTTASTYARFLKTSARKLPPIHFRSDPQIGGAAPGFNVQVDSCSTSKELSYVYRITGSRGPFSSSAAVFQDGRVVVILANSVHPEFHPELFRFVRKFVWNENCAYTLDEGASSGFPVTQLNGIEGFYRAQNSGSGFLNFLQDVQLRVVGDSIEMLGMFDSKSPGRLIPIDKDLFVASSASAVDGWRFKIYRDSSGDVVELRGDLMNYKRIPSILSVRALPVIAAGFLAVLLTIFILMLRRKKK